MMEERAGRVRSWPIRRRAVALGAWVFVAAGCSGGPPPDTTPDPGLPADAAPVDAPPAADEPLEPPATGMTPDAAPTQPGPLGETAPVQPEVADRPSADRPSADQPSADRAQTVGDLFSGTGVTSGTMGDRPQTIGELLEDAAAAEQSPGFALPADPTPGPPSAAMPPLADSLELVDRVVAIVGDTVILMSEVREKVFQLQAQGMELPTDPAGQDSLAVETLEGMVEELMIVKQADFAGIQVTEDELDDEVERRFAAIRSRFGSDEEMLSRVEQSGQNMYQFRRMLRSQARKDMVGQRFVGTQMGSMSGVRITEQEIVDHFNSVAAGTTRPATLDMVQVVIEPKPSETARDSALQDARTALEEIRDGEDFEVAARRYSDDQGTRADGGDLGWVRRSEVVPAFGDAAWAVRTGVAVGPVESRFGFHLIKVENVRGGERHVRHILIQPYIAPEQVDKARELATAVVDSIRDGASPTVMAERYGADADDARLDNAQVDRIAGALGPAYSEALRNVQSGDVVGPFEIPGNAEQPSFVVIKVMRFRPQGEYELDEVRDQIRDQLEQQKRYQALVDQLKQEVYVRMMI